MSDDATLVITDIKAALSASDKEAESKPACLLVVGGDLNGTIFDLTDGDNTVGRSPDCQIPLDFQGISRKHFKVNINADTVQISDSVSYTHLTLPTTPYV